MSAQLIHIGPEIVDLGAVQDFLAAPHCGAQLLFLGVVRSENEGAQVEGIFYDAHVTLAKSVLEEITGEAQSKFGRELRIALLHRVGFLKVGETSTVIGVASAHRSEAYEASRFLIEQLKQRVPIWKEEQYCDGERRWLDGTALVPEARGDDSCGR